MASGPGGEQPLTPHADVPAAMGVCPCADPGPTAPNPVIEALPAGRPNMRVQGGAVTEPIWSIRQMTSRRTKRPLDPIRRTEAAGRGAAASGNLGPRWAASSIGRAEDF